MGRKTNKQRLKERIDSMMSVDDLIEHLRKNFPGDAKVGVVGHFGEFYPIDRNDFYVSRGYVTPTGYWREEEREYIEIVRVMCPDIGPDPD